MKNQGVFLHKNTGSTVPRLHCDFAMWHPPSTNKGIAQIV